MKTIILYILVCLFTISSSNATTPMPKPIRFVTKMIHRNSLENSTKTAKERIDDDWKRSFERLLYINKSKNQDQYSSEDFQTRIEPGRNPDIFYAELFFGSQRAKQLVGLDTGSSLLLIQCKGCEYCDLLNVPGFDPQLSTTYFGNVSCDSSECTTTFASASMSCSLSNKCQYYIAYGKNGATYSLGTLVRDNIATSDGTSLEKIYFGCSKKLHWGPNPVFYYSGILGLGMQPISLLRQTSSNKFSYCIGDLSEKDSTHKLVIGEPLLRPYYTTPLIIDKRYYANLVGILIDDKLLNINADKIRFDRADHTGGVAFDTGSTYSYLQSVAYRELETEITRLATRAGLKRSIYAGFDFDRDLCYVGRMEDELLYFPEITFRFDGGAELKQSLSHLFYQYLDDLFCFEIQDSALSNIPGVEFSLFGVRLQQFHYIAYDFDKMRIAINRVECQFI